MSGRVYWLTGLSGAGKTTIARILHNKLLRVKENVVLLDGDELREIFGNDLGHTLEDRRISAMRNARLCKALSDQNIDVVCATISMFHDCRRWNRENIPGYIEIYLKAPIETLKAREKNGMYSQALDGACSNVVGIDIPAEEPENPDMVFINDGRHKPEEIADMIIKGIS